MLKIFSLIEFGERAGSGLSGICKRWEKVYHTPVTIEETHKDGVDRTVLTLSTGGHEQDVKAMLELYADLIDTPEPQTDPETPQTDTKTPPNTVDEPQNEPQNKKKVSLKRTQEVHEPQNEPQKLLEAVRMNPTITKAALSEILGISTSTLKRWLKSNNIVWIGHSKNGHWETVLPE